MQASNLSWINDFEDICCGYYNWYSCVKNYEIKTDVNLDLPRVIIQIRFDIHQDTYLAEKLAGKDPVPEFDHLKDLIPRYYPGDPQLTVDVNWI